jgi:hypothetical protein
MQKLPVLLLPALVAAITGCGSSSSNSSSAAQSAPAASASATTSTAATTAAAAGVNPNAPESLPPGDIPDTIAYVPFTVPGHGLTVSTPEGWSRRATTSGVVFTDKLNTIQVEDLPAKGPVTPASVRTTETPQLAATLKGFRLQSVSTVSRPAGTAIKIAYLGYSKPDPVTGKFGVLAFERYDFVHRGREVALVLSAPTGSDNVDPWRKVTTSLHFSR